jgi:hypothetical protein
MRTTRDWDWELGLEREIEERERTLQLITGELTESQIANCKSGMQMVGVGCGNGMDCWMIDLLLLFVLVL